MVKRERSVDDTDSEDEGLPTYVPPNERHRIARAPARRRPAASRPAGGVGVGVGVGVGAGAEAGAGAGSVRSAKNERRSAARKAKLQLAKNAAKIIFGIDLGTTTSGIAAACLEQLDQIFVPLSLDDSNSESPKVPSSIRFEDDRITWGKSAQESVDSIEWFKLLLIDEADLPEYARASEHVLKARDQLRELNKDAAEVIAAYLRVLWSSCLEKVKVRVGEATVTLSRFHVVVTLPAIWPDYSRQRMREAAEAAGILDQRPGVADTVISFVSEPEAAAMATLKSADGRCDIEDGDCFLVCDCGGGTVDLISYAVEHTEPMEVREAVKGSGGLHGAIFLADQFLALLAVKFNDISPTAWDIVTDEEKQQIMSTDWEEIRNSFRGDGSPIVTIRIPDSLFAAEVLDIRAQPRPMIRITPFELEQVFHPVFEKIQALVQGQIQSVVAKEGKAPKYVILVGGFGRNRYLHMYLKARVGDVEVLQSQGEEPWTAICRGAVIHGMSVEKTPSRFSVAVASRISRASYGIVCCEAWDEEKHMEEDRFFDKQRRVEQAKNQIKWLIKEGDDVMTDKKIRHTFNNLFNVDQTPPDVSTSLWMCLTSPPPTRRDDSVIKHSDLTWTTRVHWDTLPRFVNNEEEEFHELEFQTEMICSGGATELSVLHKDARVAKSNIKVDYRDRANLGA